MRIEELQQERLPFRRLLSGTWQVSRSNLLPLLACIVVFCGPGMVAWVLLPSRSPHPNLTSSLGPFALVLLLGLVAGYGGMAVAWFVSRVVSGEARDLRGAMRTALAATPRYLPASIAALIACLLALGLLLLFIGGLVFAFASTARHVPTPALIIPVDILAALATSLVLIPLVFAAIAICFYATIAVLRPVTWASTLSRSWALVRGRWWRVSWMMLVLNLPCLIVSVSGSFALPHTVPFRAGSALVELLLTPFATVGMTLLFLHLDFLGPAAAPARSEPAPAAAEVTS